MNENYEKTIEEFIARKKKNLTYFKTYRPELYDFFAEFEPSDSEVVISPETQDVDLVVGGESVYRGVAKAYSIQEVKRFLAENPREKKMVTSSPTFSGASAGNRFASYFLLKAIARSNLTKEQFSGYYRGDSFPSVIFLGCGLAYHIEELIRTSKVIDAIVFEPNAEVFYLTLFTVDWEAICSKFRGKGQSISFCIATSDDQENVRRVLGAKLSESVPLYPYFSIYYNHLGRSELYEVAKDLERDLPIIGANWGHYDFELRGLKNVIFNMKAGGNYLQRERSVLSDVPVIVVGSGPSIDQRISDIRKARDRVVVVSAGTGLRALLVNGIRPDFHVELDADYMIYEMLKDLSELHGLAGITLIASISVNPLVQSLFERHSFFFPKKSYIPLFFGVTDSNFDYCNPTCTNAALVLSYEIGYRNIYLFGTDYGQKTKEAHHSKYSVYGNEKSSEFSSQFRKEMHGSNEKRPLFPVPGVDGGTVLTRADYYSAKRSVEQFLAEVPTPADGLQVFNCSDGAEIEGVSWLSKESFLRDVLGRDAGDESREKGCLDLSTSPLPNEDLSKKLRDLSEEIRSSAQHFSSILRHSRLEGRSDLIVASNEVRSYLNRVGAHSGRESSVTVQLIGWQMMKGTIQRFLQIGMCHGLACKSDDELVEFSKKWRDVFVQFLASLPRHFDSVVFRDCAPEEDSMTSSRLVNPEPGVPSEWDSD